MVRSKEEILGILKEKYSEDTSDDTISFIEDISDTLTDYETKVNDTTDWKQKYEENDKEWRTKYKERFFDGTSDTGKETELEGAEDTTKNIVTFDDLFTTKEG